MSADEYLHRIKYLEGRVEALHRAATDARVAIFKGQISRADNILSKVVTPADMTDAVAREISEYHPE